MEVTDKPVLYPVLAAWEQRAAERTALYDKLYATVKEAKAKRFAELDTLVAGHKVTFHTLVAGSSWSENAEIPKPPEINERLTFKAPGTIAQSVIFHAIGNELHISGDYGSATFWVSCVHSLVWWAGCGADYLDKKREGDKAEDWNSELALMNLELEIFDLRSESPSKRDAKLLTLLDCEDARDAILDDGEWKMYVEDNIENTLDDSHDTWELTQLGMERDFEVDRWLHLLKMAVARLPEEIRSPKAAC